MPDYIGVKCKSSINNLVSYSDSQSCAEILMQMIPVYITDSFEEAKISELQTKDIYSVYCDEYVIYHNDASITFAQVYNRGGIKYKTKLMNE